MDVQRLIGEVARRHNVLVDPGDPIFVTVTLNELLLVEYMEKVAVALATVETTARAASREQTEQARQAAAQLMTDAARQVSEQVRMAGSTLKLQLQQLVESSLRSARGAASEASQYRTVSFWAAALAALGACVTVAMVGFAWLKL